MTSIRSALRAPLAARCSRLVLISALVALFAGCASTSHQQRSAHGQGAGEHDGLALLLARIEANDAQRPDPLDRLTNPATAFVDEALAVLGTRYRYGGTSPEEGFDCSGLIWFAANEASGVTLPRTTAALAKQGREVKRDELQRGDLVFFNTMGRRYSHVGIYLGNGKFVHAPSSGGVVRIEKLAVNYWNKRFNGARRITHLTRLAAN